MLGILGWAWLGLAPNSRVIPSLFHVSLILLGRVTTRPCYFLSDCKSLRQKSSVKSLITLCLVASYQPKQVTWPNPTLAGAGMVHVPTETKGRGGYQWLYTNVPE